MKLNKFLIGVLVVSIPFLIFLSAVRLTVFDINFYEKEFDKYNPSVENKIEITKNLIYFLSKEGDNSYISSFREVEQEHLLEVRDVMNMFFYIFYFVLVIIVLSIALLYIDKKSFFENLGISLFYSSFVGGIILIVLALLAWNFSSSFSYFHQIFFKTQWQFPSDYLLVTLFQAQFFFDIFSRILLVSLIGIILTGIIGYLINRKYKNI
ncbi:DUF1461 domain-containing protein [Candidatus Woesearchaeota archaeon]|nr:DUF1461 domain-containing protein [Candidatus Woesearchaeota archaeon]